MSPLVQVVEREQGKTVSCLMTCPSVEDPEDRTWNHIRCFVYTLFCNLGLPAKKKMFNSPSRVDKLIDVLGNKRGTHFNTKDLESMGYHFCDSLLDYCDPDRTKVIKVHLFIHQTPDTQITSPAFGPAAVCSF